MIFDGKKALVTGASKGLGKEIAERLASLGCDLHLVSRDIYSLKENAEILRSHYDINVKISSVDFTSSHDMRKFLDTKIETDILVNCAGLFPIKNICDSTTDDYNDCFSVNVKAPFELCRTVAPYMKERRWGRIVNVASSSAYNGSGETGLYCASKHALLGLTRSLYQELRPDNIRVYCVSPGSIQTDMGATDSRQDFSTFLNAEEVAEYICYAMKFDKEMVPEEIRLSRMVIR